MEQTPALELVGVSKRYGPTVALDRASFSCRPGEVHALLGENGAGKSTLVKILSGIVRPDAGSIAMAGADPRLRSSRDALAAGIATAFQELTLVPYLTGAENLLLGRQPTAMGVVRSGVVAEQARAILEEWEAPQIPLDVAVNRLALATRQQLEIIRALSRHPRLLLLDEPTAALGSSEVDWLFRQVRRARDGGVTVIYISHRMGEVRELCERATVLRNGREVGTFDTHAVSDDEVVRMMVGRTTDEEYAKRTVYSTQVGEPVLVVDELAAPPDLTGASLTLLHGEIVGVAGLQGQGQKEFFMSLFGARRAAGGRIVLNGKELRLRSPNDAIRAGMGISLVPEERKVEGLMVNMGGIANVTLPCLHRFSTLGFVNRRKERAAAADVLRTVNVKLDALDSDMTALSGGNQQKVAIGKWLLAGTQVLLMYDPTRGVDVGTKAEIFALMRRLAAEGRSILFYSTDVEELVNVCNRVVAFYRGRIVDELAGDQRTKERIVSAMLGHAAHAEALA